MNISARRLHPAGDDDADDGADGDARAPAAQDPKSTAPLAAWPRIERMRGEDDGGERGGEADLHDLRPVVAEGEEGVEEGRHQHDAAADAEQPGDDPGEGADDDEERDERQELREVGHGHGGAAPGWAGPCPSPPRRAGSTGFRQRAATSARRGAHELGPGARPVRAPPRAPPPGAGAGAALEGAEHVPGDRVERRAARRARPRCRGASPRPPPRPRRRGRARRRSRRSAAPRSAGAW